MFKKLLIGFGSLFMLLAVLAALLFYWASAFIPDDASIEKLRLSSAQDISYLQNALPQEKGRILAVVTSTRELAKLGKPTGYELTELSRAYWVFTVNGFSVDIASPEGGEPYALLDNDDMGDFDYAFLNDPAVQHKIKNTLPLDQVNPHDYQAVYFVGGKGAMLDFPDNIYIQKIIKDFVGSGKIIAAVCHGPAAFVNANDSEGDWLFAGKSLTSFTNAEELLLIPEAASVFPFLLQTKLEQRGARYHAGADYLENVVIDQMLITAQNPWSVWRLAEDTIRQLGYTPVPRETTADENSITLLKVYQESGLDKAEKLVHNTDDKYNGHLILMHAFVAVLKAELKDAVGLMILADSLRPLE